jgi:hypothetical protein
MLKLKDNVDLKKLEKYGFKISKNGYYYIIDDEEELLISADKESIHYKQIRLYLGDEYYECFTGDDTFDKLYDLIKNDLVEKVDE